MTSSPKRFEDRKILVTSALPYANGPLHLGHILEMIQTDIWVRFHRLRGADCLYVGADDAHGTAIMLKAEELGLRPEELIERVYGEHRRDFAGFHISFDEYYSTHSPENEQLARHFYQRCREGGHIVTRPIVQAYDPQRGLFLADRFVRGGCPYCQAPDQYGDNCERCGRSYNPTQLLQPVSLLSGATPEPRETEHFFFRPGDFIALLEEWIAASVQPQVANKLREWITAGLQEWDISRDAPYFGFEIPDAPGKYFYVWLDAPVGYMASFQKYCTRRGLDFDAYWGRDSRAELYHFIGKDIVNFHGLFWPAMLHAAGFRVPSGLFVHGFLTLNGEKMSKSRGTMVEAQDYLAHLDPEYLRYYLAARLGPGLEDLDLQTADFQQRVNTDLVGKLVNIASRCAGFLERHCDNLLGASCDEGRLVSELIASEEEISRCYQEREFSQGMHRIMRHADRTNQFINERKPWELARHRPQDAQLRQVCSTALNAFRLMMVYLRPVLPATAERAAHFLEDPLDWRQTPQPLGEHRIRPFTPLLRRVEKSALEGMMDAAQG